MMKNPFIHVFWLIELGVWQRCQFYGEILVNILLPTIQKIYCLHKEENEFLSHLNDAIDTEKMKEYNNYDVTALALVFPNDKAVNDAHRELNARSPSSSA